MLSPEQDARWSIEQVRKYIIETLLPKMTIATEEANEGGSCAGGSGGSLGEEALVETSVAPRLYPRVRANPAKVGKDFENGRVFEPICCLGQGGQGIITRMRDRRDGSEDAVKSVGKATLAKYAEYRKSNEEYAFRVELKILELVEHPCIVHHHGFYETNDTLFYVLEFGRGGNLADLIYWSNSSSSNDAKKQQNVDTSFLDAAHRTAVHRRTRGATKKTVSTMVADELLQRRP